MKAERTTTWRTSDDLLHREKKTAENHQSYLDLATLLRMGISAVLDSERPDTRDRVLADYLIENRDEIMKLLKHAEEAQP